MPRFSINVTMMLNEHAFLDRFAAAADLGFAAVDIQFPYDHPPEAVAERARAAGVEVVLINTPADVPGAGDLGAGDPGAGDQEAGETGLAGLPGREADFRAGLERTLEYSRALGNKRVHVLAGVRPEAADPALCRATLAGNLALAAEVLGHEGITAMLEPINGRDVPGFLVQTTEAAVEAIVAAGGGTDRGPGNPALLFDLYHRQVMQGDLIPALERHLPMIAHIQFADTPGRHEPGSGEINYGRVFQAIDELGYDGWVGAEYRPQGTTAESLGWFRR